MRRIIAEATGRLWADLGPVRAGESFSASFAQGREKLLAFLLASSQARAEIHKQYQMDVPIVRCHLAHQNHRRNSSLLEPLALLGIGTFSCPHLVRKRD
jgi:hypothetical protein